MKKMLPHEFLSDTELKSHVSAQPIYKQQCKIYYLIVLGGC